MSALLRLARRCLLTLVLAVTLTLISVPAAVPDDDARTLNDTLLPGEPRRDPATVGDGLLDGLQYPDPTSGQIEVEPPEPNSRGTAQVPYVFDLPPGRNGVAPRLNLTYDSSSKDSWVGYGWSLGVGEISVDTTFGVPLYCPRTKAPTCGNFETESYRLDGALLAPTAVRSDWQPRVAERQDFTRKVETKYEQIIRHGNRPDNYFWEVRDGSGNVSWYGGYPDAGGQPGTTGNPGSRTGVDRNDATIARSAILADDSGNGFKWYLKAQRDIFANSIRYEYETVYYQPQESPDGTDWVARTQAECQAPGTECARHVYLKEIFYTEATQTSGRAPEPTYSVRFVRQPVRTHPGLSARGGFVDLDTERLLDVEVRLLRDGPNQNQTTLISKYHLDYEPGPYRKDQLMAVTHTGCATGTCDPQTASTHKFSYYDDARLAEQGGFGVPVSWTTGNDDLGKVEGNESALGASETKSGDGHVYVGYNPLSPSKDGSFGGSATFSGGDTESVNELLDINGDGLLDKVYREGGGVRYRLNTSSPSAQPMTESGKLRVERDRMRQPVTFSDAKPAVDGLADLGRSSVFNFRGSLEGHYGLWVEFNGGIGTSTANGEFKDVNGDMLPDFVRGGSVWYNSLPDSCGVGPQAVCAPVFTKDDPAKTRNPLDVRPLTNPIPADNDHVKAWETRKKFTPPIDTVRRWVAPFEGRVQIGSAAKLVPSAGAVQPSSCPSSGVGVVVAIQHESTQLGSCTLRDPAQYWEAFKEIQVAKGDKLYFRLSPDPDLPSSAVDWAPTVTYLAYGPAGTTDNHTWYPATDANGFNPRSYSAAADFTLAGRPGLPYPLALGGGWQFSGTLNKGVTSDDLRPSLLHKFGTPGKAGKAELPVITAVKPDGTPDPLRVRSVTQRADGQWCFAIAGVTRKCSFSESDIRTELSVLHTTETGLYQISSTFEADPPVKAPNGEVAYTDRVELKLQVDSPIDPRKLTWKPQPQLCRTYLGQCHPDGPVVSAMMEPELYPASSLPAPARPFTAPPVPAGTKWRFRVTFDTAAGGPGPYGVQSYLTIKGPDGFIHKSSIDYQGGTTQVTTDVALDANKSYWVDVTTRTPALYWAIRNGVVEVKKVGEPDNLYSRVDASFNGAGNLGYFGLGHRGWGVAGYRTAADRLAPIDQAKLRLSTASGEPLPESEACEVALGWKPCGARLDQLPGYYPQDYGAEGPELDHADLQTRIRDVYAFNPTRLTLPDGSVSESWDGPRPVQSATAAGLRAARLFELPPAPVPDRAAGLGLVSPPTQVATLRSFGVNGGVGHASGTATWTWSDSELDYMDMNGDDYPDPVRNDSILYSDQRGGTACRQENGLYAGCTGGGVGVVNSQVTASHGWGFAAGVLGPSVNPRGVTNANAGAAGARGSAASQGTFGGGLGGGVSQAVQVSSPVLETPEWNPGEYSKFGFLPKPLDPQLPVQQSLADVNGDGLPDRLKVDQSGVQVRLNLGYGFTSTWRTWARRTGYESSENYSGSGQLSVGVGKAFPGWRLGGFEFSGGFAKNTSIDIARFAWKDVNADGLLDAVTHVGQAGGVGIRFGTGTGMAPLVRYGATASRPTSVEGKLVGEGDQVRQDSSVGLGGGADLTLPITAGVGFVIVNPGGHGEHTATTTDIDLKDVNGDGYLDSVQRGLGDEELRVRLNTYGRSTLLRDVTNPLGGKITIDYSRAGNTVSHPGSLWVMSQVTVDDGHPGDGPPVRSRMDYSTPAYDFVHREGLGFAEVVTSQLAADDTVLRATRHAYSNQSIFDAGLLKEVELYEGAYRPGVISNRWQRSVTTWRVIDGLTKQPMAPMSADLRLKTWGMRQLAGVSHEWYTDGSLSQATALDYEYGLAGNVKKIVDKGRMDTTADDVTTLIAYSSCTSSASPQLSLRCGGDPALKPGHWSPERCPTWVSAPVRIEVWDSSGLLRYREAPSGVCDSLRPAFQRELVSGLPTSGPTWAETQLARDSWGNTDRVVFPRSASGRSRALAFDYDPVLHGHVVKVREFDLAAPDVPAFLAHAAPPADVASVGLTTTSTYDARAGKVASETDASGNTIAYRYDALGRTDRVDMPGNAFVRYEYALADGTSRAIARHYDAQRPGDTFDTATFVDGVGRTLQRKQETALAQSSGSLPVNGFAVSGAVAFDALGRLVEERQPTFEPMGSVGTLNPIAAPAPTTTTTSYDILDRPRSVRVPDGRVTATSYRFLATPDGPMLQQEVEDPLHRKTATLSDVRGYVRRVDDVALDRQIGDQLFWKPPVSTSYKVDGLGQLLTVTQRDKEQVSNTYDRLGRRLSTTTQDAGRLVHSYDAYGNLVTSQDEKQRAAGAKTTYGYAFGRLTSVDYPDTTHDVAYTWGGYLGAPTDANRAGRLASVEDGARVQRLTYDVYGNVRTETTRMLDGERHSWSSSLADAQGFVATTFDRDWLGRLLSITYPDAEKVDNTYDLGGNLTKVTGVKGGSTYRYLDKQEYDVYGLPVLRDIGTGNRTQWQWDPKNPVRLVRRVLSSAASGSLPAGTVSQAAGAAQETLTVAEKYAAPPPPFVAGIGTEKVLVTGRSPAATQGQFTYQVQRGAGGTTAAPIPANTVVSLDRVQQNLTYGYDNADNVTGYVNDLPPDDSTKGGRSTQDYKLDAYYRLSEATGTWDANNEFQHYKVELTYDATGRVASKRQHHWEGPPSCVDPLGACVRKPFPETTFTFQGATYAADHQHQVSSQLVPGQVANTFTYDLNGNVERIGSAKGSRVLTWDADQRLRQVVDHPNGSSGGKPTYFHYDHSGARAIEDNEQGATFFVNPFVTVKNGTMWKEIFAGDERLASKRSQVTNEDQLYFFHADLMGSTNIVTDGAGQVFQHTEYFPTGEPWIEEDSTVYRSPYLFTGKYADEDHGLTDLGQRWLDTRLQMFYSPDPAPIDDPSTLLGEPRLASSYSYAYDNPARYVDPDGREGRDRGELQIQANLTGANPSPSINVKAGLVRDYRDKWLRRWAPTTEDRWILKRADRIRNFFTSRPLIEPIFDNEDGTLVWSLRGGIGMFVHPRSERRYCSAGCGLYDDAEDDSLRVTVSSDSDDDAADAALNVDSSELVTMSGTEDAQGNRFDRWGNPASESTSATGDDD